jgi:hypothetical protein
MFGLVNERRLDYSKTSKRIEGKFLPKKISPEERLARITKNKKAKGYKGSYSST